MVYAFKQAWMDRKSKERRHNRRGKNFGCGSSRPAAAVLKALGLSIAVAESMGRIFFRNAISTGFPVLIAPGITKFCEEGDEVEVNTQTGQIKNRTTGKTMNAEPLPTLLMDIINDGGIEPYLAQRLDK